MASSGLTFFPLNCQLDEKFELIEAEFGLTGFSIVVKLLQRIYGEHGYYCEWTNEVALLFAKKVGLGGSAVSEIVEASVRRGIFSKELFDKYGVLTSKGIQTRYMYAHNRRQKIEIRKEYLLLEVGDLKKNVYISNGNVYKTDENADISKQTKQDETKQNKTRRNKDSGDVFSTFEQCGFQITSRAVDELNALSEEYSTGWVIEAIKRSADRGKKSLSYIKGILNNWQTAGAIDEPKKPDKKTSYDGREVDDFEIPY